MIQFIHICIFIDIFYIYRYCGKTYAFQIIKIFVSFCINDENY